MIDSPQRVWVVIEGDRDGSQIDSVWASEELAEYRARKATMQERRRLEAIYAGLGEQYDPDDDGCSEYRVEAHEVRMSLEQREEAE